MPAEVTLAIETSQREGGVALARPGEDVREERLSPRSRHDDDLMPAIDRLFRGAGTRPRDLATVGVSVGPGGFTGLRLAVTTAKMLALALGAKVVAVPTALVVAEACPRDVSGEGPILVGLASKRGCFWATRLERGPTGWAIGRQAAELVRAEAVPLAGVTALLGDRHLPEEARERCAAAGVRVVEPRFEPRACLAVTRRLAAAGRFDDALTLAPIYARPPEAVRLWGG